MCHSYSKYKLCLVYVSNKLFLCAEELYHISLKYKLISGICFKQTFLCAKELCHISLKYKLYLISVSKKKLFFVLNNYVIYV